MGLAISPANPASTKRARSVSITDAVSATMGMAAVSGSAPEPPRRLDAVDAGQRDVHQHQVGQVCHGHRQGVLAACRLHVSKPLNRSTSRASFRFFSLSSTMRIKWPAPTGRSH